MLEDLDQVNWRKLYHAYGSAEDVPKHLLNLMSEDENIREHALDQLDSSINHQSQLFTSTLVTIPFLIEILQESPHKNETLRLVLSISDSLYLSVSDYVRIIVPEHLFLHLILDIYHAIAKGVPTYLKLLNHPDPSVRYITASILGRLTPLQNKIRPQLRRAFLRETDPLVQANLIHNLGLLFHVSRRSFSGKKLYELYEAFFEDMIQTNTDRRIQLAATTAWCNLQSPTRDIERNPESISHLLNVFGHCIAEPLATETEYLWYTHFFGIVSIIDHLKRLGIYAMAYVLEHPMLKPMDTHRIIREMIDQVFFRTGTTQRANRRLVSSYWVWIGYDMRAKKPEMSEYIYSVVSASLHFTPDKKLDDRQIFVIQKIVECDRFWELPTNLFSFFYGLPDSREELRQLVEQSQ